MIFIYSINPFISITVSELIIGGMNLFVITNIWPFIFSFRRKLNDVENLS
jgi:hypothetical protein